MSLQAFVWAVRMLTLFGIIAFLLLVFLLDPDVVGVYGEILFYLLGSMSLIGVLYLTFLGTSRIFLGDEKTVDRLGIIFRRAAFVYVGGMLLLVLKRFDLWYGWSLLLVAAFVLLLELSFPSRKKAKITDEQSRVEVREFKKL